MIIKIVSNVAEFIGYIFLLLGGVSTLLIVIWMFIELLNRYTKFELLIEYIYDKKEWLKWKQNQSNIIDRYINLTSPKDLDFLLIENYSKDAEKLKSIIFEIEFALKKKPKGQPFYEILLRDSEVNADLLNQIIALYKSIGWSEISFSCSINTVELTFIR